VTKPGTRRIGLIADTHMPPANPGVERWVEQVFAGVELILHAGDLATASVLDWLETIAPVLAARGNNDAGVPDDPRVAQYQCVTVGTTRIGVIHILEPLNWPITRLAQQYHIDPLPDVLVCGDTHEPVVAKMGGVLVVNPGSPTLPSMRVDRPGTVGLLALDDRGPTAKIVTMPATT
jgi:putative phosphoesterase